MIWPHQSHKTPEAQEKYFWRFFWCLVPQISTRLKQHILKSIRATHLILALLLKFTCAVQIQLPRPTTLCVHLYLRIIESHILNISWYYCNCMQLCLGVMTLHIWIRCGIKFVIFRYRYGDKIIPHLKRSTRCFKIVFKTIQLL